MVSKNSKNSFQDSKWLMVLDDTPHTAVQASHALDGVDILYGAV